MKLPKFIKSFINLHIPFSHSFEPNLKFLMGLELLIEEVFIGFFCNKQILRFCIKNVSFYNFNFEVLLSLTFVLKQKR